MRARVSLTDWVDRVGGSASMWPGSQKELRPTCISAVSTQLTKCCGMGELPNLGGPRCESSLFTRTEWLVPKSPVAYHTLGLLPVCICRHSGHPIFRPAPRRPPFRMGHLKQPALSAGHRHLFDYPTPSLLYFLWGFGSLGGIGLQVQIVTGIVLAMHYTPHVVCAGWVGSSD